MLEARVRVTDHALVFAFWFFFPSSVGSNVAGDCEEQKEGQLWG